MAAGMQRMVYAVLGASRGGNGNRGVVRGKRSDVDMRSGKSRVQL